MLELRNVQLVCTIGNGTSPERFSASTSRSLANDVLSLDISTSGDVFEASLTSRCPVRIIKLSAVFSRSFTDTERIFLNGYQSWTDSTEHTIHDKLKGLELIPSAAVRSYALDRSGDYNIADYGRSAGRLHGFSYGYVRSGESFSFFGSLSEDTGFTVIRTDSARNEVIFEKDCAGLCINGGYEGLRLFLTEGTEQEVFDGWFSKLGIQPRSKKAPVSGFVCSGKNVQSESTVLSALAKMEQQPFEPSVFQIGKGWQSAYGDWLSPDSGRFPLGLGPVAEKIAAEGLVPGIWLAPFVCSDSSEIWQEHRNWIAKDQHGEWLTAGYDKELLYALDITNSEVREYLRSVFDTIVNKWGFRFLRLDMLYAACILPRRTKTRGQLMSETMEFLRELAGDAEILACGVPLASAFGRADYCLVGCETGASWDGKPVMRLVSNETGSTKKCILGSVFRRQLNGRAFTSFAGEYSVTSPLLSTRQKQCLCESTASSGGLLLTSDDLSGCTGDQLRLLSGIRAMSSAVTVSAGLYGSSLRIEYQLGDRTVQRDHRL